MFFPKLIAPATGLIYVDYIDMTVHWVFGDTLERL